MNAISRLLRERHLPRVRIANAVTPAPSARRAAVAVEFALVAPLVLLFLFALIEFTRFNLIRHTANNAAYEAARNTMVPGATQSEAASVASKVLARLGVRNARITVTPTVITEVTPSVRVEIAIPVRDNSWGLMRYLGPKTIATSCQLRTERAPMVQALSLPTAPPPVANPSPAAGAVPAATPVAGSAAGASAPKPATNASSSSSGSGSAASSKPPATSSPSPSTPATPSPPKIGL